MELPDTTNSVENPIINPRISIIAAISNEGDLYYAISQSNTNTETFKIFIVYLMKLLNSKKHNWRIPLFNWMGQSIIPVNKPKLIYRFWVSG